MEAKKVGEYFRNLNDKKILFLFVAVHLLYAIFWCCLKSDLFIDEYWTYGLANHAGSVVMEIENGKEYVGTGPFDGFFTVGGYHRPLIMPMFGRNRRQMYIHLFTMSSFTQSVNFFQVCSANGLV